MSFPQAVKEEALVACARHCCICHKFCGTKMELHHIRQKAEGGEDTFDNCIPVCFDCHADMTSYDFKHPKGTKYTQNELRLHRDAWYKKVQSSSATVTLPEHLEVDRRTFLRLTELLPWNGSIQFVRYNSFAGVSFRDREISELRAFAYACEDPSFEFLDADLEGIRATLYAYIEEFLTAVAYSTFPVQGTTDSYSVPKEWRYKQPKEFNEAVERIHSATAGITESYDSLIRLGRRKLAL